MKNMSLIKKIGILGLSVAIQQTSYSGWLSNLGQRIINGAVNTVQTNVSRKVNKTVDDALDGKLGNNPNTKKEVSVDTQGVEKGTISKSTSQDSGTELQFEKIDSSGMLSLDYVKKRALPVKGVYQEIDLGTFKFKGEELYYSRLNIGEQSKELNFYLLPGTYLVTFSPRSYDHEVGVIGKHEREGIQQGYGINVLKYIEDHGLSEMTSKKGGTAYTIEVGKNGGNFHMFMVNDSAKGGALEFAIFKIPSPTLK
jgi:hypothetical protein